MPKLTIDNHDHKYIYVQYGDKALLECADCGLLKSTIEQDEPTGICSKHQKGEDPNCKICFPNMENLNTIIQQFREKCKNYEQDGGFIVYVEDYDNKDFNVDLIEDFIKQEVEKIYITLLAKAEGMNTAREVRHLIKEKILSLTK